MFRPLQGHHQAFYLKQVFKILHTLLYLFQIEEYTNVSVYNTTIYFIYFKIVYRT